MKVSSNVLYPKLVEWANDLDRLAQIRLLNEFEFTSWCKGRAVPLFGGVPGDTRNFWSRGWLRSDSVEIHRNQNRKGQSFQARVQREVSDIGEASRFPEHSNDIARPKFHPFRSFVAYKIIGSLRLSIAEHMILHPEASDFYTTMIEQLRGRVLDQEFVRKCDRWNGIVDLAILLEPLYWPWVTSRWSHGFLEDKNELNSLRTLHGARMRGVLDALGLEELKEIHRSLRYAALGIDRNELLYHLLRTSRWEIRSEVKGEIGLALWIRHIAEVIRRATEDHFVVELPEEDEGFTIWAENGRESVFGARRSLDHPAMYKKELLQRFGLDASVKVRWYTEGHTEYGFLSTVLGGIRESKVEIVNKSGKFGKNTPSDLKADLERDVAAERFSFFSIDADVRDNVKVVRLRAKEGLIIGYVDLAQPDFEFANFTLDELRAAAIHYDSTDPDHPLNSESIMSNVEWGGVTNGAAFEARYREAHGGTRKSIKGERWGQVLAELYGSIPFASGVERPVQAAIRLALRASLVSHTLQRERYVLNPESLENEERIGSN